MPLSRLGETITRYRARLRGDPARNRRRIRPGVVWVSVSVLFGVAALAGVLTVTRAGSAPRCTGVPTTITVAASPGHSSVMSSLAERWTSGKPADHGRCLAATVVSMEAGQVATVLGPGWDRNRDGVPPDVWSPESTLWLSVAASRPDAAAMLPPQPPSIASSPVVLAVRAAIARALGWPQHPPGWLEVFGAFAGPSTWARLGHPEWASLRVGLTDPSGSTAGLASVLTLLDPEAAGSVTDANLLNAIGFSQTVGAVAPDPQTFFTAQGTSTALGEASAPDIAAFPALERDVATYNSENLADPLVPAYAPNAVVADYPYAIVNASWVDAPRRAAAEQFLRYLLSPVGQDLLAAQGLRAPDRNARNTTVLQRDLGFLPTIDPPRPTPSPDQLSKIISQWTALQRPANVLVVLDTSGSMNGPVPGTKMSRLQLLQQTATAGFGLLTNRTTIGLWDFSTPENKLTNEHRLLVPVGPITGPVGPVTRQQALVTAAAGLRAGGFTPLYSTIYAAFHAHQATWQPNATNVILLITDGKNELPGGPTLDQLVDRLTREQRAAQPVQVIGIAVGPEADAEALQRVSQATGGRVFVARDPAQAVRTLILAFAGRLG